MKDLPLKAALNLLNAAPPTRTESRSARKGAR